ncbi:SWPV1-258 [Shearwaterpox virus]|uniref:SWPV1-258 n=1 Tax=Shearwaterpox virus TaxID=1974596 RepID=A0A1V0S869_CNPV|nr:SWPV1-258 [Shearwaterpox virus]
MGKYVTNIAISILITSITICYSVHTTIPTTQNVSSSEDIYDDDYEYSNHDCCNGTCPSASISADVMNSTLLNVVCITCTNYPKNFTIRWFVNETNIRNDTKDSEDIEESTGKSSSIVTQLTLDRHVYDGSNVTCVIEDPEGNSNEVISVTLMNERYLKMSRLEAANITVKFEDIDSYNLENITENYPKRTMK